MRCTPFVHGDVSGFICGASRSLPACSTPGCRGRGTLLCDHPVKREDPPKRGDTRLHKEHKILFYVWGVHGDEVSISSAPPGGHGVLQTVSIADWFHAYPVNSQSGTERL